VLAFFRDEEKLWVSHEEASPSTRSVGMPIPAPEGPIGAGETPPADGDDTLILWVDDARVTATTPGR
jgi:hypothetical protein